MGKEFRLDRWNTHEDIETYLGEILIEYRKFLKVLWTKGYVIVLFDLKTKEEWVLEFTNELDYDLIKR